MNSNNIHFTKKDILAGVVLILLIIIAYYMGIKVWVSLLIIISAGLFSPKLAKLIFRHGRKD
jgi:hypothetical protein